MKESLLETYIRANQGYANLQYLKIECLLKMLESIIKYCENKEDFFLANLIKTHLVKLEEVSKQNEEVINKIQKLTIEIREAYK